jgi:hypothetical protein
MKTPRGKCFPEVNGFPEAISPGEKKIILQVMHKLARTKSLNYPLPNITDNYPVFIGPHKSSGGIFHLFNCDIKKPHKV